MEYHVVLEITDSAQGDADFATNLTDAIVRAALLVDGVTGATVEQVGPELQEPTEP